jgi:hypothetical protein
MDINEKKEFWNRVKKTALIGGIVGACAAIGYVVGYRHCDAAIAKGMEKLFLFNPELREEMTKQIGLLMEQQKNMSS